MGNLKKLEEALFEGDLSAIKKLISENPELINQPNTNGFTPLMKAVSAMERTEEIVSYLIQSGADVNAQTDEFYRPLHFAVAVDGPTCQGDSPARIITLLVNAEADIEAKQHWGWTPLMRAVVEGTPTEVSALLDVGANPNHIFPENTLPAHLAGRTTLMAAIGNQKKCQLLVDNGADINALDLYGKNVLDYAQQSIVEAESSDIDPKTIIEEIFTDTENMMKDMLEKCAENTGIDSFSEKFNQFYEQFQQDMDKEIKKQKQQYVEEMSNYNYVDEVRKCITILENANKA